MPRAGGLADTDLAAAFLGSQEFGALTGGSLGDDGLLDLLFVNAGIDRTASELDEALASRLSSGEDRATVVADFVDSAEVVEATHYLAALSEDETGSFWFV